MTVTDGEPRSRPPRRRQKEVVDAAARVFHERGYESTSIQDIAANLGILKCSLYYYIRSKEDLLNEILWGVHDDDIENLVKMGVFFHDFRSLSEDRRARIIAARDIYDGMLRNLIAEGQTEGVVCADVDPMMAAMAALGMCNWIYQWYQPRGRLKPSEVADQFADLVVAGLACDPKSRNGKHRSELGALPFEFRQAVPASGRRSKRAAKAPTA
jgi:AcrR family transcriptional regulator